ncbi:Vitamin B12 ABC transporter, B12-binding component BtuF [Rhodovulum sp. PH10]|uniref:ABC transporter substrate-binding protein n=1 Tax=Rhodovulum sp. PH10 TaxID=1187851 RepID=UPI00027C2AD9|nr:ABC transporter substrate-binding protein [Rhodovulum sp. PH10]EJW12853.1 Vitamin B12 ABC transporter, B12-binding component BtuF [Rhodovulum sp. PH10]
MVRHLVAVLLTLLIVAPAHAAGPKRIASLNLCTDQLLMALADPEQIVGLSPYARDADRSFMAEEAKKFRLLSGTAEDVLMLEPDLVVAGRFARRATRMLLKGSGLPVAEFDIARSIAEAKADISRMGELVGHPERAAAANGRIDAALARARAAATGHARTVLAVSRRGWVPGGQTLTNDLLNAAGLVNIAPKLGFRTGGFASLETIVAARPDDILVAGGGDTPEDQGQAFLLHPALTRLYPPARRIVMPERLTVCGGPMLADALDRLAAAAGRLPP